MAHLEVDLVAADRTIWSGEASMVSAPASEGEVGILPGHTPMLAVLRAGTVRITPLQGEVVRTDVEAGFISVDENRVTVVSDSAVAGSAGR
ncbi:F0F1 ATP synthase subunit epsilon [Cellulomonas sp. ATA003]|uniref:F0F1 ATP synthase subunit epsilon n=1 Tax=Cellulomonas sp. ATA003 TaxID=3073064 RepID=UPI002873A9D6|nr:F0F1 ATP synthase subunit epsilon [Cellulomonas sp. ATA003]WNB84951.1 F0F1 ATP synthase subunit epsilon [Cellulomonas sp. ATA003]